MKYLPLVGRILFAIPFLVFGMGHFADPQMMVDNGLVPSFLPFPTLIVYVTGVVLVVGGAGLALGYKAKQAAFVLGLLLLGTTFMVWMPKMMAAGPDESQFMGFFMRDLAMTGAAFFIAYMGSGPMSLDNRSAA